MLVVHSILMFDINSKNKICSIFKVHTTYFNEQFVNFLKPNSHSFIILSNLKAKHGLGLIFDALYRFPRSKICFNPIFLKKCICPFNF